MDKRKSDSLPLLIHVVLTSFFECVPQSTREDMLIQYRELGDGCGGREAGIIFWSADWNRDQRKNYHLVGFSIFESELAFKRYVTHPQHQAFATRMSKIADWVVGDIAVGLRSIS